MCGPSVSVSQHIVPSTFSMLPFRALSLEIVVASGQESREMAQSEQRLTVCMPSSWQHTYIKNMQLVATEITSPASSGKTKYGVYTL